MAPLPWDNCVVLRALDTAPINAAVAAQRMVGWGVGRARG
jgi:hypothetical protein